jgi:hypothetical protein
MGPPSRSILTPHTGIGYQVVFGIGVGLGMQQPPIVIQTVLAERDVPIGTALILFAQTFGGALSVGIAQNVFTNELVKGLGAALPGRDPHFILGVGATELRKKFSGEALGLVVATYNASLTKAFYVSVATAALSIIGASVIEWRNVKNADPNVPGGKTLDNKLADEPSQAKLERSSADAEVDSALAKETA